MVAWEQMNSSVKSIGGMLQYINRISEDYVPFGLLIVLAVFFVTLITTMRFGIERAFLTAGILSFVIAVLLGATQVLDGIWIILLGIIIGVGMIILWIRTRSPVY